MGVRFASGALSFALLVGVIGMGAALYGEQNFSAPGPSAEERILVVDRGSGLNAIAAKLEREGLVNDDMLFRLGARFQKAERSLKAGEYAIPARASMADILELLRKGETIQRKITVAEGLTVAEAVALIRDADGLEGRIDVKPPEGSLAPETYFFQRGEERQAVLQRMRKAQTDILDELWEGRAPDLPFETRKEALALASIVEKETGVADERDRVAAVFVNRLRKGMRLQSDPTVIYGVTGGAAPLGRAITKSDLADRNSYNTYVIDGLPPTPIANPGRAAIAATLNPADTDEFYFVADGSGGHVFARTLKEHNRNVRAWRKLEAATSSD